MSLWVDKHRPTTLDKLTVHGNVTKKLEGLAASDELPHLLFYGPNGAGKKTRVMALMREVFGPGVGRVKLEHRTIKVSPSKSVEISTLGSNYHIECNPSDAGNNDRFVVQEVIKEIASHGNLSSGMGGGVGSSSDGAGGKQKSFKIVLLTEVDRLSKQAQAGLRRTMEKYSSSCRLVLIATHPSKIIEPVRSRCLGVRIPAPTTDMIADVLLETADKERVQVHLVACGEAHVHLSLIFFSQPSPSFLFRHSSPPLQCPRELAMKIAVHSERNMRRALLMLEAARVQAPVLTPDQVVQLPDWELYVCKLAREIMQTQSPQQV